MWERFKNSFNDQFLSHQDAVREFDRLYPQSHDIDTLNEVIEYEQNKGLTPQEISDFKKSDVNDMCSAKSNSLPDAKTKHFLQGKSTMSDVNKSFDADCCETERSSNISSRSSPILTPQGVSPKFKQFGKHPLKHSPVHMQGSPRNIRSFV